MWLTMLFVVLDDCKYFFKTPEILLKNAEFLGSLEYSVEVSCGCSRSMGLLSPVRYCQSPQAFEFSLRTADFGTNPMKF